MDANAFAHGEAEGGKDAGVLAIVAHVIALGSEEVEGEDGCVATFERQTARRESLFDIDIKPYDVDSQRSSSGVADSDESGASDDYATIVIDFDIDSRLYRLGR